jgi:hypothetical protein
MHSIPKEHSHPEFIFAIVPSFDAVDDRFVAPGIA